MILRICFGLDITRLSKKVALIIYYLFTPRYSTSEVVTINANQFGKLLVSMGNENDRR